MEEYCAAQGILPRFSFVPQAAVRYFEGYTAAKLEGWSDYLYDAAELAALPGRRFHRKRNKCNKFYRDYPDYRLERIGIENIAQAEGFFSEFYAHNNKEERHYGAEAALIEKALRHFSDYGLEGALLYVGQVCVAMTIGEIIGDTLFVHVEKADRAYDGSYEAINNLFVRAFANEIRYINREEDMGDEGLRQAKLAYNPVALLDKYEMTRNAP